MFEKNFRAYGVRTIWRQLRREGGDVARVMRGMGGAAHGSGEAKHRWNGCGALGGVIRGKPVRTTISDKTAATRASTRRFRSD